MLLDNAKDITVLNRTSRQFYEIWQLNSISISNNVLPRTIEQFDNAQELFEMQQKSIDQWDLDSYRKHLERTKTLISNDQKILSFCQNKFGPQKVNGINWTYVFYRLWILVPALDDPAAQQSCIESLDPKTLLDMFSQAHRERILCCIRVHLGIWPKTHELFDSAVMGKYGQTPPHMIWDEVYRILQERMVAWTEHEGS